MNDKIKERPILFNSEMVRALLGGRKTVTRRLVKGGQIPTEDFSTAPGGPRWSAIGQRHPRYGYCVFGETEDECAAELGAHGVCPYGKPGDRLWVRETWFCDHYEVMSGPYLKPADLDADEARGDGALVYAADGLEPYECEQPVWKPNIHMPRWACRILLEITDVRVERLQDITPEQCRAEGIVQRFPNVNDQFTPDILRGAFAELWMSTGGDWQANPWVWVVEFKRVTP